MYNPFPLLNETLLKDQLGKGKRYFVRQSYRRGMEARLRAAFLLRAYGEDELAEAEGHMEAIEKDIYAFLYDAGEASHVGRLLTAARQPFGYKVYYAAKKGIDWKPPKLYQEKIRHYLRRHHPDWRAERGSAPIQAGLYEEYGMLFIKFGFGEQTDTIAFDDIEKY